MKRLFTLLSLAIVVALARGQSLESFCAPDLHVAQKEGTDSIVRRYFADVPSRGDTIYVVMYTPGLGPRLEVSLNFFHDYLKAADPDAELVLLSIDCSRDVAEKYWKKMGYKSDYQMYDTTSDYYDFLSFNSSTPLCSYVLKVDKRSGRIIFSGGIQDQSLEFCKALVAERDVRPYHTYPSTGQGSTFPLPGDMGEAELSYDRHELIQPDSLFAIGLVRYQPAMRGGNLYYNDDYSGAVQCFTMTDGGDMTRRGTIAPTEDEKYMYLVSVAEDVRDLFKQRGMFYWMPLGITLLSGGAVGCVYDLPWVFEMSENNYAFFNFPAMLVRDEADLSPRDPMLLDEHFFDDMDEVESYFSNFNIIDSTRMLFGMKKMSWPVDGFEEYTGNPDHDAFMDEFYERGTPWMELVDVKTGKSIKRFGNLPEAQVATKTGYYFFYPTVDSHGGEVVYSDSYSGEVLLADNATPWDAKRTYRVFELDPERKPEIDTTKFYTLEYASDYAPYFCRSILRMRLTDDKIHVLVKVSYSTAHTTKEGVFEYRVIDRRSGEVETSFRVDKEFDDEYMIAAGLSDDEEPVLFYLSERGGRYYMTKVSQN